MRRLPAFELGLFLLITPAPATASERADPTASLTVVSYNVHGLFVPPPFAMRRTRLPQIAENVGDAQIAMLQELFYSTFRRERYRNYLLENAAQQYRIVPKNDLPDANLEQTYSSGLAMLTSLPAVKDHPPDFEAFSQCKGARGIGGIRHGNDCGSRKGFFVARLQVAGGEIDVYTTHMDSASPEADRKVRVSQLVELKAFIEQYSAGRAVLLGGDFNTQIDKCNAAALDKCQADAAALRVFLQDLELTDACEAAECSAKECGKWAMCAEERIDYIFFRGGDRLLLSLVGAEWRSPRGRNGAKLSDHPLLHATFRVARKPNATPTD